MASSYQVIVSIVYLLALLSMLLHLTDLTRAPPVVFQSSRILSLLATHLRTPEHEANASLPLYSLMR